MEAAEVLESVGISAEVIDVQTLLPFDIHHSIVASIKKTNRVVFADEDVPGGASAYMMQNVLEEQDAYRYLDAKPLTITAKEHRPAYASRWRLLLETKCRRNSGKDLCTNDGICTRSFSGTV
jgi:2-oxoisovalerate dehydrogenase E1 component